LKRISSTAFVECSGNGAIDNGDMVSISDPGILLNFVKVELMVAAEAKKFGKAILARMEACLLPSRA
jgi:hypothetical protein